MSDPTRDDVEGFERARAGSIRVPVSIHPTMTLSGPVGPVQHYDGDWRLYAEHAVGAPCEICYQVPRTDAPWPRFTRADVHNCITAASTARQDAIRAPAIREQSTALAAALSDLAERIRALVDDREGA